MEPKSAAGNHRQRQNLLCKGNTKLRNANEKPQSKHEKRARKKRKTIKTDRTQRGRAQKLLKQPLSQTLCKWPTPSTRLAPFWKIGKLVA